ncbi:hypothetical protein ACFQ9R_11280 [Nocardia sp. NPDC056541]|uniref:hypothetical protein n=1 Tax=Nocardia sp. NPDC056541 TaxID=3345860 RepID=UPI00366CC84E
MTRRFPVAHVCVSCRGIEPATTRRCLPDLDHELKFPATTAGDLGSEIKAKQLAADPNIYDLNMIERCSVGGLITYKTRD